MSQALKNLIKYLFMYKNTNTTDKAHTDTIMYFIYILIL